MLNFFSTTTKKAFFCFCWDDHVIFILNFVNVVYCINWFVNIEPSLLPWDKFHLHVVYDLFHILLNQFVNILLRTFHTHQGCWAVMIFFLSCVICFLCHSNGELIEWICIYSVLFNLWNSLRSMALTFLYISGNITLWSHQVLAFRCVGNLKSNFTTHD